MEKYSKAVSEMDSQFKKGKNHPLKKYVGRFVNVYGAKLEVVGYSYNELPGKPLLIVGASPNEGWNALEPFDVVFKKCIGYWYASIGDLID